MQIVIYKKKRLLQLWNKQQLINSFPIGIGKVETGHKKCEGDMRTPEGHYLVCVKNPNSKYHLSLGLNYPNNADAVCALNDGQISKQQSDEICRLNDEKKIPLWDTHLGGQIYIHGELETRDWSEGCIRMFNKDIESLFEVIDVGTAVTLYA